MLKNEILNKLTKNAKFWCVKKKKLQNTMNFNFLKNANY